MALFKGQSGVALPFAICLLASFASTEGLKLEHDDFEAVPMEGNRTITLRLSFDETTNEEALWPRDQAVELTFNLVDKASWAFQVLNESLIVDLNTIRKRKPIELTLHGAIIGVNQLEVLGKLVQATRAAEQGDSFDEDTNDYDYYSDLDGGRQYAPTKFPPPSEDSEEDEEGGMEEAVHVSLSSDAPTLMSSFKITCILTDRTLPDIFTLVMTIMIVLNTVNMGGQLDLQIIKEVFKKPIGPVVGAVSQFLLMPLVSSRKEVGELSYIMLYKCIVDQQQLDTRRP